MRVLVIVRRPRPDPSQVTTPLLRKYSGLLDVVAAALLLRPTDLPFTWLGPGPGRGPARLAATWRAMARHRSQLVW